MLLQQVRNDRVGRILLTQFHDRIVNWFQTVERDTVRIRTEFLNGFTQ